MERETWNTILQELRFRFSRSGGPGGQNVNKVETRVELLFDLAHSHHLTEEQRQRAQERLASYLDAEGDLRLVVSATRSQLQNRQIAVQRFQELLHSALRVRRHRRPTLPSASSVEARLEGKRRRSDTKRQREKTPHHRDTEDTDGEIER